ncbi:oxygenase MpaB family protein [Nocardiopsis rhodophaea]|uniref:Oxygenase MpaB family protein n=1 Tax=Nocardiopsis rhodophaea TaxID=280238 RepID=A0ABN2TQY7_9ACTN
MPHEPAPTAPARFVPAEGTRERHPAGDRPASAAGPGEETGRADSSSLVARGLRHGDPVADAVIAELDTLGREARASLDAGLRHGLDSLDSPPPAVAELLRESETPPFPVDAEMLRRGDTTSLSVDPFWSTIAFALGSLVHTYSAPGIARVLTGTGKLTATAARRLAETGLWRTNAILPGGLLRGAPGYLDTVHVRLLHARVRASALRRGWDTETWGIPINQTDTARTWLDFTVIPYTALRKVGIATSAEEESELYRYWAFLAHLLGLDPEWYRPVTDHASADALLSAIDATNAEPDDNARQLVAALLDAVADGQVGRALGMERAHTRTLLEALTRLFQGDATADALGIERVDAAPFLPVIAMGNARARRWQQFSVASRDLAMVETVAHRRQEFAGLGRTEYQAEVAPDADRG